MGSELPVKLTFSSDVVKRLHPTQWARNPEVSGVGVVEKVMSPSHPVGSEPQITTLTKIRHINHFVKVAPFPSEVNFPKSEIMQS